MEGRHGERRETQKEGEMRLAGTTHLLDGALASFMTA